MLTNISVILALFRYCHWFGSSSWFFLAVNFYSLSATSVTEFWRVDILFHMAKEISLYSLGGNRRKPDSI